MDGWPAPGERRAAGHFSNANLSDGIMFALEVDNKGRPIDAAWAQQRVNNEPLTSQADQRHLRDTSCIVAQRRNSPISDHELSDRC
jgi:hypothetical protein